MTAAESTPHPGMVSRRRREHADQVTQLVLKGVICWVRSRQRSSSSRARRATTPSNRSSSASSSPTSDCRRSPREGPAGPGRVRAGTSGPATDPGALHDQVTAVIRQQLDLPGGALQLGDREARVAQRRQGEACASIGSDLPRSPADLPRLSHQTGRNPHHATAGGQQIGLQPIIGYYSPTRHPILRHREQYTLRPPRKIHGEATQPHPPTRSPGYKVTLEPQPECRSPNQVAAWQGPFSD